MNEALPSASYAARPDEPPAEKTYIVDPDRTYATPDVMERLELRAGLALGVDARCPQQDGDVFAWHCPARDCLILATRRLVPGDVLLTPRGTVTELLVDFWAVLRPVGRVTSIGSLP